MATNPLFQKRHYEALADLIARKGTDQRYGKDGELRGTINSGHLQIDDLLTLLQSDNPGFKSNVFRAFIQNIRENDPNY
jgi:hypothetical protein